MNRCRWRAAGAAGIGAVCLTVAMTQPKAGAAMTEAAMMHGTVIQLPAGAGTGLAQLLTVSCPAPGRCTAAGNYFDTAGNSQAMIVAEGGGSWQQATGLPMPADAASDPHAQINSVACEQIGSCAAVGIYQAAHGQERPAAVSGRFGGWSPAAAIQLPSGAALPPEGLLWGLSCGAVRCVADGSFLDQTGKFLGLAVTRSSGHWAQARRIAAPLDAAANPDFSLLSVACNRLWFCVAVGTYINSAGFRTTASVTEAFGQWGRPHDTILPPGAGADPRASLRSVSCTSTGWCAAVGSYETASGQQEAMVLTGILGHWSAAATITPPLYADQNPNAELDGVSCVSAGLCMAVGQYLSGVNRAAMAATAIGGNWQPAMEVLPAGPAVAGPSAFTQLNAVACPWIFSCVAVGDYAKTSSDAAVMAVDVPLR